MKTVLILGAGRVSAPGIDYLVRKGGCKVVVADFDDSNFATAAKLFPSAVVLKEDAGASAAKLIGQHKPDVVFCLLPPALMPHISKLCLDKKVHLVHPAYIDAPTLELSKDIERAGLIFVTELGLDPGIDHMSASKTIEGIRASGGKVESFRSLCGALPAPEANNNPWGYKLSWSPSSLIGASKRTAKILQDGQELTWPDGETYEHVYMLDMSGFAFEVYANADATVYKEAYGIPEATSIYRGTLRYPGWCETICYMNEIKYFDTDEQDTKGFTFASFTARQAGASANPKEALCRKFGLKPWSAFIMRMEWLGFFDDRPLPFDKTSAREIVSFLFAEKLLFTPEERDLVVLADELVSVSKDGARKLHRSVLVDYGIPNKWTSIAKTTGVPPAIAVRFILEGKIKTPGLHKPTLKEIYDPVLNELASEGIKLEESVKDISK
ncbi:MAG: saccharopine dehydrogenase NADP-binding domain-containing protein [Synergistaceae bacterium]|jgi:saccharopine dehydrogenase-like NADP-dependent oxidoreductase|nr:saccharopine dehydrogenase NADP-binding domain-containing protein [Synergistaceae bacterium]